MKLTWKKFSNPILILSDAPEQLSGLARVARDLASLLSSMPEFRVGYLGRGGTGRRKFPWTQYQFPESAQWGEDYLQHVASDFFGQDSGVVLSNWDLSRMLWFAQPHTFANIRPDLSKFLGEGRNFAKWAYTPIDSTGPNEQTLGAELTAAAMGFDRVCAASEWGAAKLRLSGRTDADWIPHGLWMDKFRPVSSQPDEIRVGCVMTNQARKDWPVAFEAASQLKHEWGNRFKFWIHVDLIDRYWNLQALAVDYGVLNCLEVTQELTDDQLAQEYSRCACTLLPTGGEGFGFPIAESLACGTPCITTDYAAGQELVEPECRVPPLALRVETRHNVKRAVLSAYGFANRAIAQAERKLNDWQGRGEELRETVAHLDWQKLQHVWKRWLREGIGR